MARQDGLARLVKTLLKCREGHRNKRAEELRNLRDYRAADSPGDSADLAFEAGSDEIASQLVEVNDRELSQIDGAVARWQRRTYGTCERCLKRIPLARLNALPCTPFCIRCEREMEETSDGSDRRSRANWAHVFDAEAPLQERRIDVTELEVALSGKRRG
jgi:RNA polymerase-binding transcription factor DksA